MFEFISNMSIIEFSIAAFVWLLVAFVVVVRFQQKADGTKYEKLVKYLFIYPFVLCDWAFNVTVFTVFFLDLPDEWGELVTKRMKRYKHIYHSNEPNKLKSFRWKFATRLCKFLSKYDMGHC